MSFSHLVGKTTRNVVIRHGIGFQSAVVTAQQRSFSHFNNKHNTVQNIPSPFTFNYDQQQIIRHININGMLLRPQASLFHTTSSRLSEDPNKRSFTNSTQVTTTKKKIDDKKPTTLMGKAKKLGKSFINELRHYWTGSKLLGYEIRICFGLLRKKANGKDLTGRENRQLLRTATDLLRLIPFAVFLIVPFMEFLLPFALRFFPNMLPSTFRGKKDERRKQELSVKIEMVKFLQEAVFQRAKDVMNDSTTEEYASFVDKVESGARTDDVDVLQFATLFENKLTLDDLSRDQLVALSGLMQLDERLPSPQLRYFLRKKIEELKADDMMILREGVESLSLAELQQACAARGISTMRGSKQYLQERLREWLDLSSGQNLPISFLILANSFKVTSSTSTADAVRDTILHAPKTIVEDIRSRADEDKASANAAKIALLKDEQEKIKEEEKSDLTKDEIKRLELLHWMEKEKDIAESSVAYTPAQLKESSELLAKIAADVSFDHLRAQTQELRNILEKRRLEIEELERKREAERKSAILDLSDHPTPLHLEPKEERHPLLSRTSSALEIEDIEDIAERQRKEAKREKEKQAIELVNAQLASYMEDLHEKISAETIATAPILDKNQDGLIDREEILEAVKQISGSGESTISEAAVEHLIERMDTDHDGKVTLEEFARFAEKQKQK